MHVDMIITSIGQLLTLAGPARARRGDEMNQLGIVTDGALAIEKGKIVAIDSAEAIGKNTLRPK